MSRNEAQTRLELVDPCLIDQHGWPRTDIRVEVTAAAVDIVYGKGQRRPSGRADYVLFAPLQLQALTALKQAGEPAELLRRTKETLFAA